jgi:hypothetical protein
MTTAPAPSAAVDHAGQTIVLVWQAQWPLAVWYAQRGVVPQQSLLVKHSSAGVWQS